MKSLLNVRIVMVNTSHPGNIGAAARAMKNMGLSDLVLVQPKIFPSPEAVARASGADDLLVSARICDSLEDAIADCALVIGASARRRSIPWPEVSPRECAELVIRNPARVAILLGREHSGLNNDELERCHYLLHIPCNPEFSSLNVASALQIIAYEMRVAVEALSAESGKGNTKLATGAEMESFYGHLDVALREFGFLHKKKNTMSLLRRLRLIFNRAQLEGHELHILRGILTAARHELRRARLPDDTPKDL